MGKIKKILENELAGGTQTTDVYPVTSTKAVYDANNKRLDEILSASTEAINGVTNQVTELEQRIGDIKIDKSLNTDSVQKLCDVNIKSGQEFSFVVDGAFSANRIMLAADNSLSNRIQDYIVKGKLYTIVAQFDITEIYGFFSGDFSPSDFSLPIYTNISEAVRSLVGEADNNKRTSRYVGNSYKCFVGIGNNNAEEILGDQQGIIVPGGFGDRGVEGMISAAKYARENKIPYLGLCLGMQVSIIEYARHVCGFHDAHSIELDPNTTHPVIALMPDQNGIEDIGGTLRLGSYPCVLDKTSKAYEVYGTENINERHRHRYEVNNDFRATLVENGMKLCGTSPDGRIVEMVEIPDHPWFLATQAHPELKSRPNRPHPLFKGFIEAATKVNK